MAIPLPLPIAEPRRSIGWPRLVLRGVVAGALIAALIHYGPRLREEISAVDAWVQAAGPLAPLAFVVAAGVLIPLFAPVTAIKASAGALFGPFVGTAVCIVGQYSAAVLIYWVGRRFFSERVRALVQREPRLSILRDAAEEDNARQQFLVRMTPISFALVSYVLAGLGVRLKPYLLGCLASVPSTIVTVGFAHAARRAAELGGQPEGPAKLWNEWTIALALAALVVFGLLVRRVRPRLFAD